MLIRPIEKRDLPFMKAFLYRAIFIPEGCAQPSFRIVEDPKLSMYYDGFGRQQGDEGVVEEEKQSVVGMAWVRIIPDDSHLDDQTPSLAIAVKAEERGKDIGTQLLTALFQRLKQAGCKHVSLSVQKENPARRLYQRMGFVCVKVQADAWIMRMCLEEDDRED